MFSVSINTSLPYVDVSLDITADLLYKHVVPLTQDYLCECEILSYLQLSICHVRVYWR
jgi:hypothetical protein